MALIPGSGKNSEEKKAAQDEVLLREIDDAVREDQFREFAQKYGRVLLGVTVVGLLAFGGYLLWDSRQEAAMEATSEQLTAVLDQAEAGNLDSASNAAAKLAAGSEGGAKAAALLTQAGIAMDRGRTADAVKIYAQVAADSATPPALRDLASIREMAASFDTRSPADVIARLEPLAVPTNPWFGSAGELVAMAYLEQGNRKRAGALFGEIARSDEVPDTLRSRARQMAGLLGVDAIEDADAFMEEQRSPAAAGAQ
ncbi:MAG TPA: tetratricopeptide repeat protein [Erythrobacter sp.]|nr:tetratricopeptide repeat protein [Erythrobacter sp.]